MCIPDYGFKGDFFTFIQLIISFMFLLTIPPGLIAFFIILAFAAGFLIGCGLSTFVFSNDTRKLLIKEFKEWKAYRNEIQIEKFSDNRKV